MGCGESERRTAASPFPFPFDRSVDSLPEPSFLDLRARLEESRSYAEEDSVHVRSLIRAFDAAPPSPAGSRSATTADRDGGSLPVSPEALDASGLHTKACSPKALDAPGLHTKACSPEALDAPGLYTEACSPEDGDPAPCEDPPPCAPADEGAFAVGWTPLDDASTCSTSSVPAIEHCSSPEAERSARRDLSPTSPRWGTPNCGWSQGRVVVAMTSPRRRSCATCRSLPRVERQLRSLQKEHLQLKQALRDEKRETRRLGRLLEAEGAARTQLEAQLELEDDAFRKLMTKALYDAKCVDELEDELEAVQAQHDQLVLEQDEARRRRRAACGHVAKATAVAFVAAACYAVDVWRDYHYGTAAETWAVWHLS